MPVRKIPISYRSTTGQYALKRLQGCVGYESALERDFITLADFDLRVVSIEEQPVRIDWQDDKGCLRRYTSDFLVVFQTPQPGTCSGGIRPWLVEVKDTKTLQEKWQEFRPRFCAAVAFARSQGWTFRLRTDRRIRTPRLENAKLLLPAMNLPIVSPAHDILLQTLRFRGRTSVEDLVAAAIRPDSPARETLLMAVWNLVAWRKVGVDLSQAISLQTSLWLPVGEDPKDSCL